MTLYRRPSDVGADHFVIMHKESDGRKLAIGFIHQPTRAFLKRQRTHVNAATLHHIEHRLRSGSD